MGQMQLEARCKLLTLLETCDFEAFATMLERSGFFSFGKS